MTSLNTKCLLTLKWHSIQTWWQTQHATPYKCRENVNEKENSETSCYFFLTFLSLAMMNSLTSLGGLRIRKSYVDKKMLPGHPLKLGSNFKFRWVIPLKIKLTCTKQHAPLSCGHKSSACEKNKSESNARRRSLEEKWIISVHCSSRGLQ